MSYVAEQQTFLGGRTISVLLLGKFLHSISRVSHSSVSTILRKGHHFVTVYILYVCSIFNICIHIYLIRVGVYAGCPDISV